MEAGQKCGNSDCPNMLKEGEGVRLNEQVVLCDDCDALRLALSAGYILALTNRERENNTLAYHYA